MDAIALLKTDHRAVDRLFVKFEGAGAKAYKTKRKLVDKIISELSVHAAIEDQAFYPAVRQAAPEIDEEVLQAIEEHRIVTWVLSELERLPPEAENFEAKVTVLIENVRYHVDEEEKIIFPELRTALTRKELQDLGDTLAAAKKLAPAHPLPRLWQAHTGG